MSSLQLNSLQSMYVKLTKR